MSKVKIHIDSPDPSPETIRKYKNYNKVGGKLTRFQNFGVFRKLYAKDKRFRLILILLLVLSLLILLDEMF